MINLSEMKEKEVINIRDGSRLGMIYDFEMDLKKGEVTAIIIPGSGKIMGIFGSNNDIIIDWKKIVKIGEDIILVDLKVDEE
ncbi:MAG TPA: YlmC/YmxH family sporulation protein [Tissierellales bacterium]|nr:YlmC/YmxH family sporulation protein [Tissierellales bacterium]